jgi:dTDP-4-amino-4,6-dideoxy-D-galactose acyltransferase
MKTDLLAAFEARKEKLFFYSPYSFIREEGKKENILSLLKQHLVDEVAIHNYHTIDIQGNNYFFLSKNLSWDSDYFNFSVSKLQTILFANQSYKNIELAIQHWKNIFFSSQTKQYCFAEVPAEDIILLQAFTANGFRLVETRLHYYKSSIKNFDYQQFSVKEATENDIPNLRKVAMEARNDYDRLHADFYFDNQIADNYLATYAENAVKGFADSVLIPDDESPADCFLAIAYTEERSLGIKVSRILLTAVLPTRKGWHLKLVAETTQAAKKNNCEYILMTTQATNKAVFRTTEKLGYQLGSTSHILVFQNF